MQILYIKTSKQSAWKRVNFRGCILYNTILKANWSLWIPGPVLRPGPCQRIKTSPAKIVIQFSKAVLWKCIVLVVKYFKTFSNKSCTILNDSWWVCSARYYMGEGNTIILRRPLSILLEAYWDKKPTFREIYLNLANAHDNWKYATPSVVLIDAFFGLWQRHRMNNTETHAR